MHCLNRFIAGDYSVIDSSSFGYRVSIGRRNTITDSYIGDYSYTNEFCVIKHATIGKYCSISWNVSVGGANHDITHISMLPLSRIFEDSNFSYASFEEPTVVGNDVWIAAGAHILRGVKIGDGAVIGANAVVTKNVSPYSVVAGVPARKIKNRFPKEMIDKLLEIRWWDWTEEKIKKAKDLFRQEVTLDTVLKLYEIENE